jgi:hypothetical protein
VLHNSPEVLNKKCIHFSCRRTLRKEAIQSNLEEELFAILISYIFLFKNQLCAGEMKSTTLEMRVDRY